MWTELKQSLEQWLGQDVSNYLAPAFDGTRIVWHRLGDLVTWEQEQRQQVQPETKTTPNQQPQPESEDNVHAGQQQVVDGEIVDELAEVKEASALAQRCSTAVIEEIQDVLAKQNQLALVELQKCLKAMKRCDDKQVATHQKITITKDAFVLETGTTVNGQRTSPPGLVSKLFG